MEAARRPCVECGQVRPYTERSPCQDAFSTARSISVGPSHACTGHDKHRDSDCDDDTKASWTDRVTSQAPIYQEPTDTQPTRSTPFLGHALTDVPTASTRCDVAKAPGNGSLVPVVG